MPSLIEKFMDGSLVMAIGSITITQRCSYAPLVFHGPGKVFLLEGKIKYEFYHRYKSNELAKVMNLGSGDVAGKLVSQDTLFDFEALDSTGRRWKAQMVSAHGDHSASLGFFKGEIDVLSLEETLDKPHRDTIHQVYFDHHRFPVHPVLAEAGYEFVTAGMDVRINRDVSGCDVTMEANSLSHELSNSMRKTLNVISGAQLEIAVAEKVIGQVKIIELHSRNGELPERALSQPVDFYSSHKLDCFESFFKPVFASMASGQGDVFYAQWHKLNRAWQGGIESAALNVSICIEGLLSHYFKALGKDADFLKLAKAAEEKVAALDVDERVKKSLLSSLSHAGGFKARTALHALVKQGKISPELDSKWSLLRNKMAHAAKLDESRDKFQELVDLTFASIKLFYELLFLVIDYTGERVDYTGHNFPTVDPSSATTPST